jgi:hypothetical protein
MNFQLAATIKDRSTTDSNAFTQHAAKQFAARLETWCAVNSVLPSRADPKGVRKQQFLCPKSTR